MGSENFALYRPVTSAYDPNVASFGVQTLQSVPSTSQVKAVIPDRCFERRISRAAPYAAMSIGLTVGTGLLVWRFLPLSLPWAPLWVLYAYVNGTFATGVWVIAHECGHRAFARGTRLQDAVGYILHSMLLVPYFSWQRSHAIHHAKTNHLIEGETHVPKRSNTRRGARVLEMRRRIGSRTHGVLTIAARLGIGWPSYLLVGSTGGAERGVTNHFWPSKPFSEALFPKRWKPKVRRSSAGVLAVIGLLVWWAVVGSPSEVLAVYVGPYLIVNGWLVTYTWLQHTDQDVPHYADSEWSFVRGAFCSIDRPYGRIADFLHHRIGSTHVAHHLDPKIPHYRAREATQAVSESFPQLYRYDPTPIRRALWRVAKTCHVVAPSQNGWQFTDFEVLGDVETPAGAA